MLGLRVEEFQPLADDVSVALSRGVGSVWSEEVHLEGAEAVERFTTGALAGRPAVTRHRFGRGSAWYLATRPDPATMRHLLDRVREEAGVGPVLPGLPTGVQARVRRTGSGPCYVVLNHGTESAVISLPAPMHDELTGTGPVTSVRLDARGVAVLRPA
jgi:beta-galactosidase